MALAFVARWDGDGEIYVVGADGGGPKQLTNNDIGDGAPIWSPTGESIAFLSGTPSGWHLYAMRADGSEKRLLAPGLFSRSLAWSRDGRWIALAGVGAEGIPDLYVVKADGTSLANLTNANGGLVTVDFPSWSSDGTAIAFEAALDPHGVFTSVHTLGSDGSNPRVLLGDEPSIDSSPEWHPQGNTLLFVSQLGVGLAPSQVVIADARGRIRRPLTEAASYTSDAHWSPDGRMIAYVAGTLDSHGKLIHSTLYVLNLDGTGQTTITEGEGFVGSIAWAPDNRHLAFVTNASTPSGTNLYGADICSGQVSLLANDVSDLDTPHWRP